MKSSATFQRVASLFIKLFGNYAKCAYILKFLLNIFESDSDENAVKMQVKSNQNIKHDFMTLASVDQNKQKSSIFC